MSPLSFNLPKGWAKEIGTNGNTYFYPSTGEHTSLLYPAKESASLSSGQSEADCLADVVSAALKAMGNASVLEATELSISGFPALRVKADVELKDQSMSMTVQMCVIYASGDVYALIGGSVNGKYDDAISACLDTLEIEIEAPSQPAEQDTVSSDLKEALDSYEAFMDEYIEFMERYKESGDATSLIADYADYMQKYYDFMSKIDGIDADSLSPADYAYYIEVTSRVSKKLLSVSM